MSRRITLLCLTAVLVLGLTAAGAAAAPGPATSSTTATTGAPAPTPPTTTPPTTTPPSTPGHVRATAEPVPGQYIVTLKSATPSGVPATAADLAARHGGTVFHVYQHALRGFAVRMTAAQATALSEEPTVAAVEQDGVVHASTIQPGVDGLGARGLDRIDQHTQPLDNLYHYGSDGTGVHAYIIDTGIETALGDFGGRASFGIDEREINGTDMHDMVPTPPHGTDCNGHGTHVSGILGGTTYGVAKKVSLVEVRVLDCNGNGISSDVAGGVDWVSAHAIQPAVANMSLGTMQFQQDPALDSAVTNSIATGPHGISYSVAAGNSSADACNASPSDIGGTHGPALSAAAMDPTNDVIAGFTNQGACVDLFAPGVNITSDWPDTSCSSSLQFTCTLSGTSMATPHVAGAAALYLSTYQTATPATVKTVLDNDATPGVVVFAGPPNKLLYTGMGVPTLSNIPTGAPPQLSWTAPSAASTVPPNAPEDGGSPITSYNVYRGTTSGGEGTTPIANVSALTTTFSDAGAPCGETLFYQVSAVNPVGETRSNEQMAAPCGAGYFALPPLRILDTRNNTGGHPGPLGQGQVLNLHVRGTGGVPDNNVTSVVLNVTVTNATQPSFLTVFPTGEALPNASNLNFVPGRDVPNRVTVEVGAGGDVSFYNNAGSTDVTADVGGYFNDSQTGGNVFTPVAPPSRLLDTRTSTGGHPGPLGQGQTLTLQVAGQGGVPPSGVTSVVLNVTGTDETQPSFLTVYPTDVSRPNSSDLNVYPGVDIANLDVVKVSSSGQVTIYNNAGSSDVVVDVTGYYTSGSGQHFIAVPPGRVLDSRTSTGNWPGPLGQGQSRPLTVQGHVGLPASGVTAVVINTTVTDATQPSFLTVYPSAVSPPTASNLNFRPGQDVPNLVIVGTGTGNQISFYNNAGSVDVVGDVAGYYQ